MLKKSLQCRSLISKQIFLPCICTHICTHLFFLFFSFPTRHRDTVERYVRRIWVYYLEFSAKKNINYSESCSANGHRRTLSVVSSRPFGYRYCKRIKHCRHYRFVSARYLLGVAPLKAGRHETLRLPPRSPIDCRIKNLKDIYGRL